jgi:hypothetical protein
MITDYFVIVKPVAQPYYYSNHDGTVEVTKPSPYFSSLAARITSSPNQENSTGVLYQQPTATVSACSTSSSSLSSLHPNSSKPFW